VGATEALTGRVKEAREIASADPRTIFPVENFIKWASLASPRNQQQPFHPINIKVFRLSPKICRPEIAPSETITGLNYGRRRRRADVHYFGA
jgi:hypothetical protein